MTQVIAPTNCNGHGGDNDSDGICDDWEVSSGSTPGLRVSFTDTSHGTVTYQYNIPCVIGRTIQQDHSGLSVCPVAGKKDIYLELDWFHNHDPDPKAIWDVVQAFDKIGIALHIQNGTSTSSGDISTHFCHVNLGSTDTGAAGSTCSLNSSPSESFNTLKQNFFGTTAERGGDSTICPSSQLPSNHGTMDLPDNAYNCLTAKRQVFHYGMLVNYRSSPDQGSSGYGEPYGNDFLVSLGNFTNHKGNIDEQEAAIMHELGHNLGLLHSGGVPTSGSDDDNNCKPNYLSIMSYTFEFRKTADSCRPLAFSNKVLGGTGLNEPNTTPSLGDSNIESYTYPSDNPPNPDTGATCPTSTQRQLFWSEGGAVQSDTANKVEDWNKDGSHPGSMYSQNLNKLGITGCNTDTQTTLLTGFNDTDFIYNGGGTITLPLVFRAGSYFTSGPIVGGDTEIGIDQRGNETNSGGVTDAIPPTINISSPPDNSVSNTPTITVSGDSSDNVAVRTVTWKIDSGSVLPATGTTSWSFTTPSLPDSTYAIQVNATDLAGNTASQTIHVRVDTGGNLPCPQNNPLCTPMGLLALAAGFVTAIIMSFVGAWVAIRRN